MDPTRRSSIIRRVENSRRALAASHALLERTPDGTHTRRQILWYGYSGRGRVQLSPAPSGLPVFELVALAASAGGLSALSTILSQLPRGFPLPLAVVQHLDPDHDSFMVEILARRTALAVKAASNDEMITAGVVYVAQPGWHLEVDARHHIYLTQTDRVHFVRPSADRLFESAARAYGRIIGVVLSGSGVDGAEGAQAIKAAGGFVIAQDEQTSAFFGMPHAAIETGAVDLVLPLDEIAPALMNLVRAVS